MITLEDSIDINTTPEIIYNWICNLDKNYKKWHPDHVKCINRTGELRVGTLIYTEEYLHGKLHKINMKIVKLELNKMIEYRNNFPHSLIITGGSFIFKAKGKKSNFTAHIYCKGGKTLEKIFRSKIANLKLHMREEGENLKKLLEN
ncbi:MAG: SRPBCC family protein [Thermoplasmata archaeon]|nr:SRPBCC family protein [Thermoplasmata archaeon]